MVGTEVIIAVRTGVSWETRIKDHLKDLVRNSVEETLNALLDHEANELVKADRYERSGN